MVTPIFWVTFHSETILAGEKLKSSTPMNLPDFLPVYFHCFPIFRGCPGGRGRDSPWRSRPRGRRAAELGRTQRHIGRAAGLVHGGSGGL